MEGRDDREGLVRMTRSPRTILGGLMVLGSWLWVASETVNDHPTFAAVACLATLLFFSSFVSREQR